MAASNQTVLDVAMILLSQVGSHKALAIATQMEQVQGNKSFRQSVRAIRETLSRAVEREEQLSKNTRIKNVNW